MLLLQMGHGPDLKLILSIVTQADRGGLSADGRGPHDQTIVGNLGITPHRVASSLLP